MKVEERLAPRMRSTGPVREPEEFPWFREHPHEPAASPAVHTVASWHDLLGFSGMLSKAGWRLDHDEAQILVARLRCLTTWLKDAAFGGGEQLVLNDGAVNTFSPAMYERQIGSRHDLINWLHSRLKVHCIVTGLEQDWQLPGLRTVICEGQLIVHEPGEEWDDRASGHLYPFSTQLNTALTKCYVADQAGSRSGLAKGGIYIEDAVVRSLVDRFDCHIYGEQYLFLYGLPVTKDVSIYDATVQFFQLPGSEWRGKGLLEDRSSWLKLGRKITLSFRGLEFSLIEVEAYSPPDEAALFWFDSLTGDQHGFTDDGVVQVNEDGSPRYNSPELTAVEKQLLQNYLDSLNEFCSANGCLPQEYRMDGKAPLHARVGIPGESGVYMESPSGLYVPVGTHPFHVPPGHRWAQRILGGERLRQAVKHGLVRIERPASDAEE